MLPRDRTLTMQVWVGSSGQKKTSTLEQSKTTTHVSSPLMAETLALREASSLLLTGKKIQKPEI